MKAKLTVIFLVLTIATATAQTSDKVARTPALNYDWNPGFINITELNAGFGLALVDAPYAKNYFGITTVNGYQFTRNIKGGIGLGVLAFNGGTLFPLYVDARYSFQRTGVCPFPCRCGRRGAQP